MKKSHTLLLLLICSINIFANDACTDAQLITCGEVIMASTEDATVDETAPFCNVLVGAPGRWYQFTGTGQAIEVKTCLSSYDTKLHVYEGDCDNLVCIAGNDDRCGLQSRINFNSEDRKDYYILVNGNRNDVGEFRLELICIITGCTDEAACNYNPIATVEDDSCNPGDCAGNCNGTETGPTGAGSPCDDDNPLTQNSKYDENCDCQPEGITCDYPLVIDNLPFSISGDTENFGNDYRDNPCESSFLRGNDFVMEFTPTITGMYNFYADNLSNTSGLLVFESCPDEEGSICIGRSTSVSTTEAIDALPLNANTTYYIIISTNANGLTTPFNFNLERNIIEACTDPAACNYNELAEIDDGSCFSCETACPGELCDDGDPNTEKSVYDDDCNCIVPTPGTNCEFPVTIEAVPFSVSTNTEDYNNDYFDNPCGTYFLEGDEFVMEFTPTKTGDYNLMADDELGYIWLLVFEGCPNLSTSLCLSSSSYKIDLLQLTEGKTYYIVVAAYDSNSSASFDFFIERYIIKGCIDETACNYNPIAEQDDGSCFSCDLFCPGDVCDDGNPETEFTIYDKNCNCAVPTPGISCDFPYEIGSLPFNITKNIVNSFIDYNVNPCGDKYLLGEEFIITFTPEVTGNYEFIYIEFIGKVRLSIYEQCPNQVDTLCIGTPSPTNTNFELEANQTYYIILSSTNEALISLDIRRDAIYGCTDVNACNYLELAEEDDGSCMDCGSNCPGDPCDDNNPNTNNTVLNENCDCLPYIRLIDNRGTDFWVMFNSNSEFEIEPDDDDDDDNINIMTIPNPNKFYIFLTGDQFSEGQIEIPGLGYNESFKVIPDSITRIELPKAVEFLPKDTIAGKAVHITATNDIVVYGLNQRGATTDAYTAIPTDALGTEYLISTYEGGFDDTINSLFGIVATEDHTKVNITLPYSSPTHQAGEPFSIILNHGEAYQYASFGLYDVTGAIVEADKPVAVFGGHNCTFIPANFAACDHIVEQFASVDAWGKKFYAGSLAGRTGGDLFRMLAAFDNTTIRINSDDVATINRRAFYEVILPSDSFYEIEASQPIQLTQYSLGSTIDGANSDPFMMMIPPFEQFSGSTTFATPNTNIPTNFVNIVTPKQGLDKIQLDNFILPGAAFQQIGNSDFYGIRVPVSVGVHRIKADNIPFGAFIYGFGFFDSYGYPAGAVFSPISTVASLVVSPDEMEKELSEEHCLEAIVNDQFNNPVAGVRVDFEVAGDNVTTGFAFTDQEGYAIYCYTGNTAGEDTIKATITGLEDQAYASWSGILGCTDLLACNYEPEATVDDGSCIDSGCVMPITLISFTGKATEKGNLLKWVTASEIDNDYFTLQSSADGILFNSLTTVKGAGTTSSIHTYEFLDRQAASDITYYQLQQTDFDGTSSQSKIISVHRGETEFGILNLQTSAQYIRLQIQAPSFATQLELIDVQGRVLFSDLYEVHQRVQSFFIPIDGLASGMYLLVVKSGAHLEVRKVMVE